MSYNFARFFADVDTRFWTIVVEGELVVVEHQLSATLPNGRSYVNDYCFVYELRKGLVWRIREYMDTRAVGRRCMAKTNQFSWSSSWSIDEKYAYASTTPGSNLPSDNAGRAPRAIYESISSTDQTREGRP